MTERGNGPETGFPTVSGPSWHHTNNGYVMRTIATLTGATAGLIGGLKPATTRVFVDLENVYGAPWHHLDPGWVTTWTRQVLDLLPAAPTRVAACSALLALVVPELNRRHIGVTPVRATRDAADLALIDELRHLPDRVDRVVVLSGDHSFLDVVTDLVARGVHVTVGGPTGGVSARLADAATETLSLQPGMDNDQTLSPLAWLDRHLEQDDESTHIACPSCQRDDSQVVALCGAILDCSQQIPPREALDVCDSCNDLVVTHQCPHP